MKEGSAISTPEKPPVRVRYWVEVMRGSGVEESVEEFTWAEWSAMTTAQREAACDCLVEVGMQNVVGGGWEVDGDEPPPAPDVPRLAAWDRAYEVVCEVRDRYPRLPNDVPTEEIVDALVQAGLLGSDPR